MTMKRTAMAVLLILSTLIAAAQDDKNKRPSPPGSAQFTFADGKKVTIDYSRPSVKGRKIYGGLVPYGQVWRTGANEATTFVTEKDIDIGGDPGPQRSETLFTGATQPGGEVDNNKQNR